MIDTGVRQYAEFHVAMTGARPRVSELPACLQTGFGKAVFRYADAYCGKRRESLIYAAALHDHSVRAEAVNRFTPWQEVIGYYGYDRSLRTSGGRLNVDGVIEHQQKHGALPDECTEWEET